MIRTVTPDDAAVIAEIYNEYVSNTVITFETEPLSPPEMQRRILSVSGEYPWLVYGDGGRIRGYAYAAGWKKRSAYRYTVESAVYVDCACRGKGIGTALMTALIERLKSLHVHAVVACIALPNPPSVRLHEQLGFCQVSLFREAGYKFDRWIDVGDWQLLL